MYFINQIIAVFAKSLVPKESQALNNPENNIEDVHLWI
jgi:hypothetical protein